MALQRRKILKQALNLGVGTDTVPADSGGLLVGDKIGVQTFMGTTFLNPEFFDDASVSLRLDDAVATIGSDVGVVAIPPDAEAGLPSSFPANISWLDFRTGTLADPLTSQDSRLPNVLIRRFDNTVNYAGGSSDIIIGSPPQGSALRVESSAGSDNVDRLTTAIFQVFAGTAPSAGAASPSDFKVALFPAASRGTGSSSPIVALNPLVQWSTAGAITGCEIDINNKHADQQLNDTTNYSGLVILNGSTYITDKAIIVGCAPFAPGISRGLVLTSILDRGIQFSGNSSGVVSTSGTAVTYSAGNNFNTAWRGQIWINGTKYTISTVNSTTSITLTSTAGTQTDVGYSYGYPDQVIYINPMGAANATGPTSFDSGEMRFVTSHYNSGLVEHSFALRSIVTSATAAKFSLQFDSAEKATLHSNGDFVLAGSIATGGQNVFAGASINLLRVTPSDDTAGVVMYGTNAANSQANWIMNKNGDYEWLSAGTSSSATGKISHANTAARTYTFPDISSSVIATSSVNSVSPTSANRTFTVDIGGTTYYIWGKTTND